MKNIFFFKSKKTILNERINESEIRYRRLFETAKDGILILDFKSGKIVDANPFIVTMIDLPLEEILQKNLWEIGLFSNKEESEQAFIELKDKGYIRFEDMPIQRPNGKIYEVEFICNVYTANKLLVIQCNIRDISQRKQIEKALLESQQILQKQNHDYLVLNKEYITLNNTLTHSLQKIEMINKELVIAKEKAEESDNLKSAFLTNMSHEIRTPLNSIIGFSDLLSDPDFSKEKIQSFISIIKASGFHLLSVISDIIDISKIESGQINIETEVISIHNLTNDILVTYKNILQGKKTNIHLICDQSIQDIQIISDRNRIKQILCNLINNAIKFTPEGEIEFGYNIKEKFIEFYVKDNGLGIANENQALIFDRFRQIENKYIFGGNGLGLSISKALVEKLGGYITVISKQSIGSTFMFTIPYDKVNANSPIPIEPAKRTKLQLKWETKTILIVEDEIDNHTYLEELLANSHAILLHAWNGEEAITQVIKHPEISLVLMDIKLSKMNGYEATRRIRVMRPSLPIIAQTAFAQSKDKQEALNAGCNNYISKPIDKIFLMNLLHQYLS